ncbi:hypothetical protein WJ42_14035 [Burkholderia cepacia]|nr:hypothetical protein WJ42_14035 [Burkholderia cepacia]KWC72969.1 hypothetical protein WL55_03995 [Burkholderia cepacia]
MEDGAHLDKKYSAELNAKQVKLVGAVKAKGFSGKVTSNVWSAIADDGGISRLMVIITCRWF